MIASIESNFIMDDVRYDINVTSCFFPSLLVIFSSSPYARERKRVWAQGVTLFPCAQFFAKPSQSNESLQTSPPQTATEEKFERMLHSNFHTTTPNSFPPQGGVTHRCHEHSTDHTSCGVVYRYRLELRSTGGLAVVKSQSDYNRAVLDHVLQAGTYDPPRS